MKSVLVLLAIALMWSGCGAKLRPDPSISAIEAGYPTAELRVNGALAHGLTILSVLRGSDLAALDVRVQGYYEGTVRLSSEACSVNVSRSYANSEEIRVPLAGAASQSCVIAVTVNPRYPKQEKQAIVVHGFRGYVVVIVRDPGDWIGETRKVSGQWSSTFRATVGGSGTVRVIAQGCGRSFDQAVELNGAGEVELELAAAVEPRPSGFCVLSGIIISPEYEDLLFSVAVAQYDPRFTPLPTPSLSTGKKGELHVKAHESVSVIAGDGLYVVDRKAELKPAPSILRLLTVKGRSVIGIRNGEAWSWKQ